MDQDEIAKRVADLKLSTEARTKGVKLSASETAGGQSVASKLILGKIFSERTVNREALKDNLPNLLKPRGPMEVELVGRNTFALTLDLQSDKERILSEGPWHYFQDLMILQKAENMATATDTDFEYITMWIQLHNMPIACMTPAIIRRIGEQVGTVLEVDDNNGRSCIGRFARVKVTRSIKEPLVRGVPLSTEDAKEATMVLILYEKLPDHMCFACGKLGHYIKNCDAGDVAKANPSYGTWCPNITTLI